MSLRERVEDNLVVWLLGSLLTGFLAGIATYQAILEIAHLEVVPEAKLAELQSSTRNGGVQPVSPNLEFSECRQSIEEAVNSGSWSQAQRIGIDCSARLNLETGSASFADLTFWMGRAYEGGGQLPEALDSFNQAYRAAVELANERMAVDNLFGKSRILRALGRPNDAQACLREALSRAERLSPLERETYKAAARRELEAFALRKDQVVPPPITIAGQWESSTPFGSYDIYFSQNGNEVTGEYIGTTEGKTKGVQGRITGILTGRILRGNWKDNANAGRITLNLNKDGNKFHASYVGRDGTEREWSGTRLRGSV